MKEEWKQIKRLPGYEVSNKGRIRKGSLILTQRVSNNGYKCITLLIPVHRLVAEEFLDLSVAKYVDHKDGNRTNNDISNLRAVTSQQNNQNRKAHSNRAASKYKNVFFRKDLRTKPWWSSILVGGMRKNGGKLKHLGYFKTEKEAAMAYNEMALREYGEYARLNVIT